VRQGLLQAGLTYERLQQPDKAQRFFRELLDKHAGSAEAKKANDHLRPN
jgi:TolA-binding protein